MHQNQLPKPRNQNATVEIANTTKFLDKIFTQFLARANPDSTHAKPAFIKNTSMAVTSTKIVSAATFRSIIYLPSLNSSEQQITDGV